MKRMTHADFVNEMQAVGRRQLQSAYEETVASVIGKTQPYPVYADRSQFFALPFVLSATEWKEWRLACELLVNCIHRYAEERILAEGDRFLSKIGICPERAQQLSLAGGWPRLERTLARPDFFHGPSGPLFLEANIDSSLGGLGTADPLSRIIGRNSLVTRYLGDVSCSTNLIPTLAKQLLDVAGKTSDPCPSVVIFDWKDEIDAAPWPYDWLMRDLAEYGFRLDLWSERNGWAVDSLVHVFYRGITPVTKLWERIDSFQAIWTAASAGVPVLSTLWDVVLSSKALFGELWCSAAKGELASEDTEFILQHLPWSWPLAQIECIHEGLKLETLSFARQAREQLVLKSPSDGSCKNILVGRHCSDAEWIAALTRAVAIPGYILQQYIVPTTRRNLDGLSGDVSWKDFRCVDSVFVFGGRGAGTCIRGTSTDTPYISCMHGAQEGIALIC